MKSRGQCLQMCLIQIFKALASYSERAWKSKNKPDAVHSVAVH